MSDDVIHLWSCTDEEYETAFNDWLDDTNGPWGSFGHYITKDQIKIELPQELFTVPLEYAENSWLPNEVREPRSHSVLIGLSDTYMRADGWHTIVIAPLGKDVHQFELTEEQWEDFKTVGDAHFKFLRRIHSK